MKIADSVVTTKDKAWQRGSANKVRANRIPNLVITDHEDQVWSGFGGCFNEIGWQALKALPSSKRDAIIRDLFKPGTGCNFNLCRLPIGANDYALDWYSLNETVDDFGMQRFSIKRDRQNLIPYIKTAMAYQPALRLCDEALFALYPAWFPPLSPGWSVVWQCRGLQGQEVHRHYRPQPVPCCEGSQHRSRRRRVQVESAARLSCHTGSQQPSVN